MIIVKEYPKEYIPSLNISIQFVIVDMSKDGTVGEGVKREA